MPDADILESSALRWLSRRNSSRWLGKTLPSRVAPSTATDAVPATAAPVRMGRIVRVRPQYRDEYLRCHTAVWPDVLAAIRRGNIRNYSIYLHGNVGFSYFEYIGKNLAVDLAAMQRDDAVQRWQAMTMPMLQPGTDTEAGLVWTEMTEIFHAD